MEQQGGIVRWVIEADDSRFNEAVDNAQEKAQQLSKNLSNVDSQTGVFQGITSNANSATSALKGLASAVAGIGWSAFSAGATAATGALTTLIAKGIQGTDFLETAQTQMSGLLGTMEAGNYALSLAAKFWQNNPFDRFTTTSATKQLVQFGRSLNDIGTDLDLLGSISLSTGVALDELARYYARTAASGRAMTIDIEMMSDRGIPIYQKLAEVTGTTAQGVRELASEGKISFEIFREALERAINPEAMAQFEETLARQKDRLSGSISILAGDLAGYKIINDQLVISANGLTKAWTRMVQALATALRGEKIRASLEKLGYTLASILDKVTPLIPILVDKLGSALEFVSNHSASLIPILGAVLAVVGKLGSNLPIVGGVIGGLGNSFGKLKTSIVSLVTTNPLLAAFIAIFGAGFISAIKNNEDFRKSISELLSALGNLVQSLMPVVKTFIKIFAELASSDAVVGTLMVIVKALTTVANVIASFPTDVLVGIVTAFLTFRLLNMNPLMGMAVAVLTVAGALKTLFKQIGGLKGIGQFFSNLWRGITEGVGNLVKGIKTAVGTVFTALITPFKNALNFLKDIPGRLLTIGNNLMVGLFNGIVEGSKKVINFVKSLALNIINTFKGIFGIHSPSTVMAEQGRYLTLGLANGIAAGSSIVERAMNALASDILSTAEKVISTQREFGLLDYNSEYKAWKKVSKLFTVGSTQYAQAMEKMEDARKSVNLRILSLQNEYNDTLDTTIAKISSMYSLFEKVDFSGGMNIGDITSNLDEQVSRLQEWAAAQEAIANLDLDPRFIEELQAMGVDATNELAAIAGATTDQLATLNNLWLKKQEIASRAATKQLEGLKKDTLDEISSLKDGIDGETIDVVEVGGRLVSNIGEGITGALPTLEEAFSQLDSYIAEQASMLGSTAESGLDLANVLDSEDLASSMTSGFSDVMDEIKTSVEGMSKGMFGALAGVLAGAAGWKLLKGVLSKQASGLKGIFSSVLAGFGGTKASTKGVKTAVESLSEVGTSVTNVSKELTKAGTQLTKAQSMLKTMRSGILNIILLAGAIAAMGVALKVAYDMVPDDILGLVGKLVVIGGVVTAMGGLAVIAGKLDDSIRPGLKMIAIIAGEIALTALAIGAANLLIPDDVGQIIPKLGIMALAIGGMGVLAGVAGIFDDTIMEGLKLIARVAGEIALTAIALGIANAMIPEDLGTMVGKLGIMGLAIVEFGALAALIKLVPVDMKSGLVMMALIAGEIALVGIALGVADAAIKSDFDVFMGKLGIMGLAILEFGVLAGIIGAVMATGIGAVLMGAGLAALLGICGGIVATAIAIGRIDKEVPDNIDRVKGKIALMTEALDAMISADFGSIFDNLKNAINVALIAGVAEGFRHIGITLKEISEIEIDIETITDKVEKIKRVVEILATLQTGGVFEQLKNAVNTSLMTTTVDNIRDIVGKVSEAVIILKTLDSVVGDEGQVHIYVERIKLIVAQLSLLQSGSFWSNLGNAMSTGMMTKVVDNVHTIVSKISDCIKKLKELEGIVGGNATTVVFYVDLVKLIVAQLATLQTGGFWKQLDNANATAQIKKTTESISGIVNEVTNIVKTLAQLNDNYGGGKAKAYVEQAIGIMEQFKGVKLDDGTVGWFSKTTYEKTANNLEDVKKTSTLISEIVNAAADVFKNIQSFVNENYDTNEMIIQAVGIMEHFAGVDLADGGHGWFKKNTYERVAEDLEQVKRVAGAISEIVQSASEIGNTIKEFSRGGKDITSYVEQANKIIQALADIKIPQDWVADTAEKSNSVSTTATNMGNILGAAKDIVEAIKLFTEQELDVPAMVAKANEIIQAIAEIKLDQEHLEKTSENAGFLSTAATNVDNILGTAENIVQKIQNFAKIGVDTVIGYVADSNRIIAEFGKLNLNGDKNYQQLAENATSLSSAVGSAKEILDKASDMIETVRSFVEKYDLNTLSEQIVGDNGINNVLKTIAQIKVEGLGNGEEKLANLEIVKQMIDRVSEIAEAMNSVPDTAEKVANIKTIIKFIEEELSTLPTALQQYDDAFIEVGTVYADKFAEGWSNQYKLAIEDGKTMAEKYVEGIESAYKLFSDAGATVQGKFWEAIETRLSDEVAQGATLAGKVLEGINSKLGEFASVGANAVQGFINGASNANPYGAGVRLADQFLQGLKDRGKQGSPWKTTFESGTWAVAGLIEGLQDGEDALVNEASSLAEQVIDTLSMDDLELSPTLNGEINPFVSNLPSMNFEDDYESPYGLQSGSRTVTIEQTNNNYTQYSIEKLNRDLAWEMSKV